jgi:RND superfamily putative drug exporter
MWPPPALGRLERPRWPHRPADDLQGADIMLSHALYRWGRLAARRPLTVIGSWLVLAVLVVGASATFGRDLEDNMEVPGLDSQQAADLLAAAGSDRAGLTAQVVLTPRDQRATFSGSADARAALGRVQAAVAGLPKVLGTTDPAVSPDGRVALIGVHYPTQDELGRDDLERLKALGAEAATGSPLRVELGGDLFFAFEEPGGTGELVGLAAAAVILLLAFGSLVAMGLPIGLAVVGLALAVSSMSLVAHLVDVPSWATQLGTMVGLGVGIDYALFIVTRHREFLARGMAVEEAAGRAVATAGQAVVFAGGTVVIAILGLAVAGIPFVTAGGIAISVIVLTMVAASVTLLPAFLGLAGPWINRLGIRRRAHDGARVGSGWRRWGGHVSRNALAYAVGVTVLLLALTAPVLALRMGMPGEGALPETRTERRAYDLVADGFGPGRNGPLVIAVDVAEDPGVLEPLRAAVEADQGIAAVAPPEVDADAGVATLVAFPTTGPQDAATQATVERLRADVFPAVLGGGPASAHVGGQAASFADLGDRIRERLPLLVAAVVLLSFLLLTVVFRSVVVPLKAALLNLLSIGASYGVLVAVFQWGWGAGLIGLESTVPVVAFIPMFMFAITFGLSMDYEVFLLSRVRGEYVATGDNDAAVIRGIAGTARVITSAALIMISVFLGFALGDDPAIKMFGLGLATAIFVDATIVRMVLVPATMKLLGDANWWLPGWLDRLLPAVELDGSAGSPAGGTVPSAGVAGVASELVGTAPTRGDS